MAGVLARNSPLESLTLYPPSFLMCLSRRGRPLLVSNESHTILTSLSEFPPLPSVTGSGKPMDEATVKDQRHDVEERRLE